MRKAPYHHTDGSNCWTKNCKLGNTYRADIDSTLKSLTISPEALMVASSFIPRDFDEAHAKYYAQTDEKHFKNIESPGSKFTDPQVSNLEELLALKIMQDGVHVFSSQDDDREKLIAAGSYVDGFKEDNRYYMVQTPGKVGVISSDVLSNDDLVDVVRTKDGVPCSLVVGVDEKPATNYGVIIMGIHTVTQKPFVITAFPGPVTKSISNKSIDALEGERITVKQAKKLLDEDSFWCNTRLIK